MESRSKAPLALMEQVIMVLVFALAAAICVKAFVMARSMSIQSRTRDRAMEICQSMAEQYKSEQLNTTPEAVFYDGMWRVTEENSTYKLEFKADNNDAYEVSGTLYMVEVEKNKIICKLKVAWQKEGAHE
ncbi:hypothetical protein SAMN02910358_01766 [Lachnospiraceae bacterium XBB1006]|nr:hypothetical protein SAMN02910358_01766 [Lachnospiraceae bacterium XBB1006]